jgi:hypothetical protein
MMRGRDNDPAALTTKAALDWLRGFLQNYEG